MASGQSNYRSAIRSAVRGLWSGVLDEMQFWTAMDTAIRNGLQVAYLAGAKECGTLGMDELSPEMRLELQSLMTNELGQVGGFASAITEGSKANGGKLGPLFARADLWVMRYTDVVSRGKVAACGDRKLEWVLHLVHFTADPCRTCAVKLNGKVKRASYWQKMGVYPQGPPNPNLECGGWRCGCGFRVTDKPLSRGPLPSLP